MNYKQRIGKVIDFIGENLDQELSLDDLSAIACFSKYHFHRIFSAYTGLSLQHYIRWLRLKRAAHQLVVERDMPIIQIALNAGFESHESFSRAFKQICGSSPTDFRVSSSWAFWENTPYLIHKKSEQIMNVTVKTMPTRRLALIEHRGSPQKVGESVNKLINWAKAQPINLKPKPGEAFGFGYHDPQEVPEEDFRFDLALSVPENFKLEGGVIEKYLPAGRYAVAVHKGSRQNMGETISGIYRDWLVKTQEELGDLPCIFCYYNFDHEVAETELLTEIWVYLK